MNDDDILGLSSEEFSQLSERLLYATALVSIFVMSYTGLDGIEFRILALLVLSQAYVGFKIYMLEDVNSGDNDES